jgi:hypothetical protein
MAVLAPFLLIGSALVATAGRSANADIARIYPDHAPAATDLGREVTDTL